MNHLNQIPENYFNEMLQTHLKNKKDAVITVGMIKNGETSFRVYGKNGVELPQVQHTYEIGSITKTITAALVFKAISEGKLALYDQIDKHLSLPKKDYYPTIKRLLTHTSGYKSYYFESEMLLNLVTGRNAFYKISTEKILNRIGKINLEDKDCSFSYSNFGFSVLGAVLSAVYETPYKKLVNAFLKEDLKLVDTKIFDGKGDLKNYWDWKEDDGYLSAGAVVSNIHDMLSYARLQLESELLSITQTHQKLASISLNSKHYNEKNVFLDYIGGAWIGDGKNNLMWHNGATGNYNSYMGFDKQKKLAVVVLSNLPVKLKFNATMMGVKLLEDLQNNVV